MEIVVKAVYINNKTGDEYVLEGVGINCTNKNDGQEMVRYSKSTLDVELYRELHEFKKKFTKKD